MYELWYWDGIPGRGEFVRLALEAAELPYREPPRRKGHDLMTDLAAARDTPPFAPPYLKADGMVIGQTANILLFLGEKHGMAPAGLAGRLWVHQMQLTIADWVDEVHDTHHPIDPALYYEDQKSESVRRAAAFRTARLPKYLRYFENILKRKGPFLTGADWTYADLSLFWMVEGLRFAFPRRMRTLERKYRRVVKLHSLVSEIAPLAAYLASTRRQPFSEGIFRHYPELDAA